MRTDLASAVEPPARQFQHRRQHESAGDGERRGSERRLQDEHEHGADRAVEEAAQRVMLRAPPANLPAHPLVGS